VVEVMHVRARHAAAAGGDARDALTRVVHPRLAAAVYNNTMPGRG
jgi:hypothetical protein